MVQLGGMEVCVTGWLGPFTEAIPSEETDGETVDQGRDEQAGILLDEGSGNAFSFLVHLRSVGLLALWDSLMPCQISTDRGKKGPERLVHGGVTPEIRPREENKETGGSEHIHVP